jgi:hypothetical protein
MSGRRITYHSLCLLLLYARLLVQLASHIHSLAIVAPYRLSVCGMEEVHMEEVHLEEIRLEEVHMEEVHLLNGCLDSRLPRCVCALPHLR